MNYPPLLTSLLTAFLALAGCEKNAIGPEAGLPAATATGAETLGFALNAAAWAPAGQRCGLYGCADNRVEASSHLSGRRRFLLLTAVRTDGRRNESFVLQIDSLAGPGVYRATAGGPGATGAEAGTKLYFADGRRGQQYQSRPGTATITVTAVDTVRNLVAGTFAGELSSLRAGEPAVQISAGRFDIFYNR